MCNTKATFAEIRFSDFQISHKDQYTIMVGSRKLAEVKDKNFNTKLRILADKKYDIYIIRNSDEVLVTNYIIKLKNKEFTNVSYTAFATVKVRGVYNGNKGEKYTIIIDGNKYKPGNILKKNQCKRGTQLHDFV